MALLICFLIVANVVALREDFGQVDDVTDRAESEDPCRKKKPCHLVKGFIEQGGVKRQFGNNDQLMCGKNGVDNKYKVKNATVWLDAKPFTPVHEAHWFKKMFGVQDIHKMCCPCSEGAQLHVGAAHDTRGLGLLSWVRTDHLGSYNVWERQSALMEPEEYGHWPRLGRFWGKTKNGIRYALKRTRMWANKHYIAWSIIKIGTATAIGFATGGLGTLIASGAWTAIEIAKYRANLIEEVRDIDENPQLRSVAKAICKSNAKSQFALLVMFQALTVVVPFVHEASGLVHLEAFWNEYIKSHAGFELKDGYEVFDASSGEKTVKGGVELGYYYGLDAFRQANKYVKQKKAGERQFRQDLQQFDQLGQRLDDEIDDMQAYLDRENSNLEKSRHRREPNGSLLEVNSLQRLPATAHAVKVSCQAVVDEGPSVYDPVSLHSLGVNPEKPSKYAVALREPCTDTPWRPGERLTCKQARAQIIEEDSLNVSQDDEPLMAEVLGACPRPASIACYNESSGTWPYSSVPNGSGPDVPPYYIGDIRMASDVDAEKAKNDTAKGPAELALDRLGMMVALLQAAS